MSLRPESLLRRSQLARWHIEHDAVFASFADRSVVIAYQNEAFAGPGLCDLSLLPRTGLKGRGAPDLLASLLTHLPQMPNHALTNSDGTVVARLSNEEFLILGPLDFDSHVVREIDTATNSASEKAAYPLPRADSHCLFALIGAKAADAMAKLCAVDLRTHKFPPGAIAQTSIARGNGIIISHEFGPEPGFFILCDAASTEYLWNSIIDAIDEYGGGAVGLQSITSTDRI